MTQPQRSDSGFGSVICQERQRLEQDFVAACHELNTLQSEQVNAVLMGDSDFTRFDDLLHMAREKKDYAKYTLLAHVEQHRCQGD
jgi:hypothetical protein